MWPRGATVARLTPDQKVACSNHVEVSRPVFCNTNFRLHGCMWKLFLPQVATWNLDHLVGPLDLWRNWVDLSQFHQSQLIWSPLSSDCAEWKTKPSHNLFRFFLFWALHFFTINMKHIFPHCFFISWYMFYLFLWVLDFLLWILEGKSQVSDISFSFWGPGWQSYTDVDFYFNDICGWFLVILSRNRIHEKTLDFDFRFILCDICHFTFSWYFNDFIENCNRKMFNWRILNFSVFHVWGL